MLICTLERDKIESLSTIIEDKNNLSPLNRFTPKDCSEEDKDVLIRMGMVNEEGNILDTIKPTINILTNPHAVAKLTFTGGVGTYEHNINYDASYKKYVSFTVMPNKFSIDDETNLESLIDTVQDFIGKSNLKSISISKKLNKNEALVIASIIDMERRASLRAFVDEMAINHNAYNANMIWRIINSTSTSIQWFVSILNKVIGGHATLTLQQVQEALEQLIEKEIVVLNGGQYQLIGEMSQLSDRMLIIDNVLSAQISKLEDQGIKIAGFTCIQSGVHDLLFLDYNGEEMLLETITSGRLLEYLKIMLNCETYISKL